jgi:hypothetical protein
MDLDGLPKSALKLPDFRFGPYSPTGSLLHITVLLLKHNYLAACRAIRIILHIAEIQVYISKVFI